MRISFIVPTIIAVLICLASCKKNNNDSTQLLIRGKWNMQTLHYVEYMGSVKTIDTVQSNSNFSDQVQFNSDGTFTNIYIDNINDTISGSYKVSGDMLSFSNYHSNFIFLPTPYPLVLPPPAANIVSISNQITQLNNTNLVIHSESDVPGNATYSTSKIITDQYYTK